MEQTVERMRREMGDKCSMGELMELKSKLLGQVEAKVELKEVQQALNECQTDIGAQLQEFKKAVQDQVHDAESELYRALERKANLLDVQEALAHKAEYKEVQAQSASRSEVQELQSHVEKLAKDVQGKVDVRSKALSAMRFGRFRRV